MPYKEIHIITIGPITLPEGVSVSVVTAAGTGGRQDVTITGVTGTAKADTEAALALAFAELMTAASAEGVGQPVFQSAPVLGGPPAPAPVTP